MTFTRSDLFLVTGASSGIGCAVAHSLLEEGGSVIGVGRDEQKLLSVHSDYYKRGYFHGECRDLSTDIDALHKWIFDLAKKYGRIKGLVLCAGVRPTKPLKAISYDASIRIFNINYFSNIQIIKGFSSKLVSSDTDSSIVVISSIVAQRPQMGLCDYAGSKAALSNSVKTLALELAPRIRINAILPGIVDTEMIRQWKGQEYDSYREQIDKTYPLGIGRPEDIANACVFLLSQKSRWITGSEIVIDGGASI